MPNEFLFHAYMDPDNGDTLICYPIHEMLAKEIRYRCVDVQFSSMEDLLKWWKGVDSGAIRFGDGDKSSALIHLTLATEEKHRYILTCEDASHLGGPMGTEYTTHVFSKGFGSISDAQQYATDYQGKQYRKDYEGQRWPKYATWRDWKDGHISCDSGLYIWTIKEEKE